MPQQFPIQLAQLIAQQRQGGGIQQPQPMQIQGGMNASIGGAQIGEQFGKGVGDQIQATIGEAQKKQYMEENDPQVMRQKALQFVELYQKMGAQEREMVKKSAHTNPQAYMMLTKMSKAAPELFNKVTTDPGKPDEIFPIEFVPPKSQIEAQDFQAIPQQQRVQNMQAPAQLQQAQAGTERAQQGLLGAQATAIPQRTAIDQQQANAQTEQAKAQMLKAQVDQKMATLAEGLQEAKKASEQALANYHNAQAQYLGRRDTPEARAAMAAVTQEKIRAKNNLEMYRRTTIKSFSDEDQKILSAGLTSIKALEARVDNATNTARVLRGGDPKDPAVYEVLNTAVDALLKQSLTPTGGIDMSPQKVRLAESIMETLGRTERVSDINSLDNILGIWGRVAKHFWPRWVPEAKNAQEAKQAIEKRIRDIRVQESKRILGQKPSKIQED